jgi:hypothetical protein
VEQKNRRSRTQREKPARTGFSLGRSRHKRNTRWNKGGTSGQAGCTWRTRGGTPTWEGPAPDTRDRRRRRQTTVTVAPADDAPPRRPPPKSDENGATGVPVRGGEAEAPAACGSCSQPSVRARRLRLSSAGPSCCARAGASYLEFCAGDARSDVSLIPDEEPVSVYAWKRRVMEPVQGWGAGARKGSACKSPQPAVQGEEIETESPTPAEPGIRPKPSTSGVPMFSANPQAKAPDYSCCTQRTYSKKLLVIPEALGGEEVGAVRVKVPSVPRQSSFPSPSGESVKVPSRKRARFPQTRVSRLRARSPRQRQDYQEGRRQRSFPEARDANNWGETRSFRRPRRARTARTKPRAFRVPGSRRRRGGRAVGREAGTGGT